MSVEGALLQLIGEMRQQLADQQGTIARLTAELEQLRRERDGVGGGT